MRLGSNRHHRGTSSHTNPANGLFHSFLAPFSAPPVSGIFLRAGATHRRISGEGNLTMACKTKKAKPAKAPAKKKK
jgi:hypothetical protein